MEEENELTMGEKVFVGACGVLALAGFIWGQVLFDRVEKYAEAFVHQNMISILRWIWILYILAGIAALVSALYTRKPVLFVIPTAMMFGFALWVTHQYDLDLEAGKSWAHEAAKDAREIVDRHPLDLGGSAPVFDWSNALYVCVPHGEIVDSYFCLEYEKSSSELKNYGWVGDDDYRGEPRWQDIVSNADVAKRFDTDLQDPKAGHW